VELCCLLCDDRFSFLSATILKEIAGLGGDVRNWAPVHVLDALSRKYATIGDRPAKVISKSEGKLAHHE
jgi:hypothetical protein